MKTRKSLSKVWAIVLMLVLVMAIIGCSKGDDVNSPDTFIKTTATTFTIDGVNNCTLNNGNTATQFNFKTPYTTSTGIKIKNMKVKTSDGASFSSDSKKFQDDGSNISWGACSRYENLESREWQVELISEEGIISNVSKVNVNKPEGAN